MSTMKVVQLRGFGSTDNFEVADAPMPIVPKGWVRIKLSAAAFNPVDYKMRKGNFGGDLPLILGGDASGVIDEVGEGVTQFKKGDEVMAFTMGTPKSSGSYAEYVSIHEHLVGHRPSNVDLVSAASIPLVGLTVYELVIRRASVQKGDAVLVTGASGGTGSLAVQFLKTTGAHPIIVTAGSDESEEYIHSHLGIPKEHIIRHTGKSVADLAIEVNKITNGDGVKHAFDLVGGNMKLFCFEALAMSGHILTIVEEEDPKFVTPLYPSQGGLNTLFMKDSNFSTIFIGALVSFGKPESWKMFSEGLVYIKRLFETDQIKLPRVTIVGNFTSETVANAHKQLEQGSTKGKLVMQIP